MPRTALPEVLRRIAASSADEHGVRVANVFHAGDGNLHPLVLFDDAVEGEAERAEEVSGAILDLCIEYGGSITGEHGVGMDKAKYMPRMFTDADLDTMQLVRCAFDPRGLANPGRSFRRPGCAARCPAGTRASTRCRRRARGGVLSHVRAVARARRRRRGRGGPGGRGGRSSGMVDGPAAGDGPAAR